MLRIRKCVRVYDIRMFINIQLRIYHPPEFMIIFIKNAPANTSINDLYEFVEPALKRTFPFKSGLILKAEILALKDKRTNELEFHGIMQIEPEKASHRAIRKLKGKKLKNKLVLVREYISRDWHNDRRINHGAVSAEIMEKRLGDRRRGDKLEVVVKDASNIFKAVTPARKLI